MSERGPNDIDLGSSDKGIVLHVLMLWNATCYEEVSQAMFSTRYFRVKAWLGGSCLTF